MLTFYTVLMCYWSMALYMGGHSTWAGTLHACVSNQLYVHTYVYMYTYTYMYVYICIYIYIYRSHSTEA